VSGIDSSHAKLSITDVPLLEPLTITKAKYPQISRASTGGRSPATRQPLELREVIEEVADDLATAPECEIGEYSNSS
jgi:hypothetical protein